MTFVGSPDRADSTNMSSAEESARSSPVIAHLAADGFIAYPTETVWGLGACAGRPAAIEALVAWKGRSDKAPMSILVPSVRAAAELGCILGESARRLAEAFWPGPLTLVVPCDKRYPEALQGDGGAIGLRCSPHPIAHGLAIAALDAGLGPLTSTSMNRSGEPPVSDLPAARALLAEMAPSAAMGPLLVSEADAGLGEGFQDAGGAAPSSVVDCTGDVPRVLRPGALPADSLEEVWTGKATQQESNR